MTNRPEKFVFTNHSFDAATGTLLLDYSYPGVCDFSETVIFGPSKHKLSGAEQTALANAFRALHLTAGIAITKHISQK